MKSIFIQWGAGLIIFACAKSVYSKPNLSIGSDISVDISYVENANRANESADQVEELQTVASVGLDVGYTSSDIIDFAMNYALFNRTFSEGTQEDYDEVEGGALLRLKNTSDTFALEVGQSRRQVLEDPTGVSISSNLDTQDTLGAKLSAKTSPLRSTQLVLSGTFNQVEYEEFTGNDSKRSGADLTVNRFISPTATISFNVGYSRVDFPNFPLADYELTTAYAMFARNLRRIRYSAALGIQVVDDSVSDGEEEKPYLQLNLTVNPDGTTSLSFQLSSVVTDTSQGDLPDINDLVDEDPGNDFDSSLLQQDQIQMNTIEATLRNGAIICDLCVISARLGYREEKYLHLTSEDSEEAMADLMFAYKPTRTWTLSLSTAFKDFRYVNQEEGRDFNELISRVELGYKSVRQLSWSTYIESESREYTSYDYTMNSIGMSLSKRF